MKTGQDIQIDVSGGQAPLDHYGTTIISIAIPVIRYEYRSV